MKTPTASPSRMPCVSSAASCQCSPRFPPRAKLALHEAVLNEILEERVVSSRGAAGAARGQTQDEQLSAATPRTTANHPDRFHYRHSDRKMNSIGVNQDLPGKGKRRASRLPRVSRRL